MNKIVEIKFGSHLYGTNTPSSDLDYKAIYLPDKRDIVLGRVKQTIAKSRPKAECERNNKDDVDMEILSLDRYLELLMEGQTMALDILFAPESAYTENSTAQGKAQMRWIRMNKERLLTRNVNAFVGYARQQAAKYGIKGSRMDSLKRTSTVLHAIYAGGGERDKLMFHRELIDILVKECQDLISLEKLPLIELVMLKGPKGLDNEPHLRVNGRSIPLHATVKYATDIVDKMLEGYGLRAHKAHLAGGVDWKALSHAVRVNCEALELLSTGHITFPRPERELLLQIKLGQLPYEQVAEMIEEGLAKLYVARETSKLVETPDKEWADNLIYEIYSSIVKK